MVAAEFVSMEDGTGIVHLAPAFGPDDLAVGPGAGVAGLQAGGRRRAIHRPGTRRSCAGSFVKDADPTIVEDLRERGVLLRAETYEHNYPFCWRCETPLLYYARTSWYVRTTAVKDRLLEVNERRQLVPRPHQARPLRQLAGEQRGLGALAASATGARRCRSGGARTGHVTAIGSLAELGELAGRDVSDVDPHRPRSTR